MEAARQSGMQVIANLALRQGAWVGEGGEAVSGVALHADPVDAARALHRQGLAAFQVTDLDGLESGRPHRMLDLLDVVMAVSAPVQVRGGFRTVEDVGQILSRGAARVAVEVTAVPLLILRAMIRCFGERLVPALPLDCTAAPGGESGAAAASAWASHLGAAGAQRLLCLAVDRPGQRADMEGVRRLAAAGLPLMVAAGGAHGAHLAELAGCPGVEALILDGATLRRASPGSAASDAAEEMGE